MTRQWRALLSLALATTGALALTVAVPAGTALAAGRTASGLSSTHEADQPVASCAALATSLKLANATVTGAQANTSGSFTPPLSQGGGPAVTGLPPFCDVTLTQTNPPATDQVHIEVWLPLQGWNGRFQGVGGGGYSCGISYSAMAPALQAGYATASTDCGHTPAQDNGSFALNANGTLNWPLIVDFAYRGMHEMTVDGKAAVAAFYGSAASYTYFNGCSTGGREALMEAQRYPADYNGILAGSPAINWDKFMVAQMWGEFVMNQLGDFLPQCKLNAFREAAISACETTHGVNYGEIMNPADCRFNPYSLVGESTPCGTITRTDAKVVELILRGEKTKLLGGKFLWYGLEPGTDFSGLDNTVTTSGVTSGSPFSISVTWLQYWLTRNPNFNWQTMTIKQLNHFFVQSETEFALMETSNPNLKPFRREGGKILIWTGLADQLIYPQGAIQYYDNVIHTVGSLKATQSFARFFLAPGNGHCGGDSVGPVATDQFTALTNWVENGVAPTTLLATETNSSGAVTETRPQCAYPDGAVYNGTGNINDSASFHCARVFRGAGT